MPYGATEISIFSGAVSVFLLWAPMFLHWPLPLLVLALTGAPTQASLIAAETLPYLILGLPAGALVDRWNRKTVMIGCDVVRCLAFGSVPLALFLGYLTLAQVYLVALLQGITFVFFNIAEVAALPHVVARAHLAAATGINSAADEAGAIVGPALGGLIISLARTSLVGVALAYLVDSLSYLVSIISLTLIRPPLWTKPASSPKRSLLTETREGFHVLWGERPLRILSLLALSINLFGAPLSLAVIILARGPLHLDVSLIGLILSVEGLSGLTGSLLAPWLKAYLRSGLLMLGTLAGQALATTLLALAFNPFLVLVGAVLVGPMAPIYGVVVLSYRLHLVPDHFQGRVTSVFRLLIFGGKSVGLALAGLLLGTLGPRPLLWVMAAGMAFATAMVGITSISRVE